MWIESRTDAADQFLPGSLGANRPLVGTRSDHHFVSIGDGEDSSTQGYVVAGQSPRITFAVKSLVVLFDGHRPRSQPGGKRFDELRPVNRVTLQRVPFGLRRLSRFTQDRPGYLEFSDVVEQGGPTQSVLVRLDNFSSMARRSAKALTRSQCPRVIRSCRRERPER